MSGVLPYGNDEVIRHFAGTIQTGKQPELIGHGEAFHVLAMQNKVLRSG